MSNKKQRARRAAADEKFYLGPQMPEGITGDDAIVKAMAAQLEKYRSNPMSQREIEAAQDKVREAFGDVQPQRMPSAADAAEQAEPPFVKLCRTLVNTGARGKSAARTLQDAVWRLDAGIAESALFHEWEARMGPVMHLASVTTASGNPAPPLASNPNNVYLMTLISPRAVSSAGKMARAIESYIGVSCLGALIVPERGHMLAIFDYHDTRQYACCVLLKLEDPVLLTEYAEELAEATAAPGAPPVRDFFTLPPVFFQESGNDPMAAEKHKQSPKLMRWITAPAVFVTSVYFDRIKIPYMELIEYT